MYLIYSLIIVTALSLIMPRFIKKNSKIFYGLATIIGILVTIYEILRLTEGYKLDGFIGALEKAFMKGNVAIIFFVLVMFAGALNKKYSVTKKLLSIRAELAILGSILIMPHCIMYAVRFINKFITGKPIGVLYVIYLIIGLIAFFIMIPLFITSLKKIRCKMYFEKWKKIQKFAYPFYLLVYIHILLALLNHKIDLLKIVIYTILFVGYFILKIINENKN